MFKLLKWAAGLLLSFLVVLIILRFLPVGLKTAALNFVNSFVMPSDNRPSVILNQLEDNLRTLQKTAAVDSEIAKVVEESKKLIDDLKASVSR